MSAAAKRQPVVLPASAARRFEAIIFTGDRPADAAGTARLRELGAAAGAATVELVTHIALHGIDDALHDLRRIGIGAAEVLVVGPEVSQIPTGPVCLRGGIQMLAAVVQDQIARRRDGELPIIDRDPTWTLAVNHGHAAKHDQAAKSGAPVGRHVHEGLLTLADGVLGARGSVLISDSEQDAGVLMSGAYTGRGPATRLLEGPGWNTVSLAAPAALTGGRVLDLRAGTLAHELTGGTAQVQALLLSSLARPATTLLRARGSNVALAAGDQLRAPAGSEHQQGVDGDCEWMRVIGSPRSIVAARRARITTSTNVAANGAETHHWLLDRASSYAVDKSGSDGRQVVIDPDRSRGVVDAANEAGELGFDTLFAEHRRAWAARWEEADIAIEGDTELQLGVRLALFHMIASVTDRGEAAVGARGLTGPGYRGHVFWDSDVYVLPFLAATHPSCARAMLEYRVARLPASLAAARAQGRSGARFAWESAVSGQDITPVTAPNAAGGTDPVYSGPQEEHVVADVAWSAAHYIDWTGDQAFARGPGLELLVQTARWWASRIQLDDDGSAHIRTVMGPDEYHESVDDDAYTNVMARWNLRRAADAAAGTAASAEHERNHWLELADAITDGYDPATGIYEQFAGWNALEPLVIADLAPQRPVSADTLLGHARVRAAQIVKQPDVLMLHYLIPQELAPGSLEPNLAYYDPRTAHGSSLSVGVHAALMARAGHLAPALELLGLASRIDLDDLGGESAQGVHLAAMGSVWRAITYGFAGLRPAGDALAIDPVLPSGWESLKLCVRFQESRIRLCIRPGTVEVSASTAVAVLIPSGDRVMLGQRPQSFAISRL